MTESLEERMTDVTDAYLTHNTRLKNVAKNFKCDVESLRLLHQSVQNTLVMHGYDLQAQDFVNEHNRVFTSLMNTVESMGETLIDIGNDVEIAMGLHTEMLKEMRKKVDEWEYKSKE